MRLPFRLTLGALALALLTVPPAYPQAQATTGVIQGLVQDEDGGALPGVNISMTNTATGFQKTVITEVNGRFFSPLMPLGPYTVTASLEGFATLVREGLELQLGQSINLVFSMQLSAVGEEITVSGEAPLIESTRTETQIRLDNRTIEGLPNDGRNFLDFNTLTPGVTLVQGPDGDELSINGQKGISNNVMVDGADFNNPFFGEQRGGQRPPYTFNIDAVKEVLVVTEGAPAEFGRSSGGFVNVVTKSGTNKYNATAHVFYKSDGLSEDPVRRDGSKEKREFDQAQYGFTLGGPIRQDRAFFFLAADTQDADETKQTDPGRIDAEVVNFLASVGLANENAAIDRTDDADAYLAKVDYQINDKNLLTGRWAYHYSQQFNGTFDVDSWGVSANGVEIDYAHGYTATLISTISDSLLNEFRGQYAKEWRPRPYPGPQVPGQNRPFPDTAFDFAGGYRVGLPFFLPIEYDDDRTQINNNVSLLKGNHSIKLGIEYNDVTSSQTFIGFANGRYIFSSFDGFRNYAGNRNYVECSDGSSSPNGVCPGGSSVVGPVLLYLQFAGVGGRSAAQAGTQGIEQTETALFVQDQWQPTANLTLEYGLRWESLDMPDPITPPSEVFFAPFIGQTVETEAGPQRFPSDGLIPDDDEQIQPRLALAWTPKGKADRILRFSSGIYHARIPALAIASARSTNGSVGQTLFRNSELGGLGILPVPPPWPNIIPVEQVGGPVFFPDVFVFDEDFETPRTWSSAISWEQEFIPNFAFLFKVNYAKTDHITRWVNRNDPLLGSPWSSGLPPGGINGIGALNTVESTAKSRYWGYTFGINKRWSNNYQFQFYYTNSLDRSDDDNERDPFTIRYANIFRLDKEFSVSDRHQRHRLNFWLLWNAPKGIDVNVRWSYRDAQPQDITPSGDPVPGFPPTARCLPSPTTGGCAADSDVFRRNQGEKDNEFNSLDLRISKNFDVGGWTIQPILDIFNLFDEENFFAPEVTNLIFNFDGTVRSGAGEPREIQLGVRFVR